MTALTQIFNSFTPGLTLLVGRAKTGKTGCAIQGLMELAAEGRRVLLICPTARTSSLLRRLNGAMEHFGCCCDFRVSCNWDRPDAGGLEALEADLAANPADLVILDADSPRGTSWNCTEVEVELTRLCVRFGCSIWLVGTGLGSSGTGAETVVEFTRGGLRIEGRATPATGYTLRFTDEWIVEPLQ